MQVNGAHLFKVVVLIDIFALVYRCFQSVLIFYHTNMPFLNEWQRFGAVFPFIPQREHRHGPHDCVDRRCQKRGKWQPSKNTKLCGAHFEDDQFNISGLLNINWVLQAAKGQQHPVNVPTHTSTLAGVWRDRETE